jgi:2-hydroxy-3-keto-5-methylthiopentenyl-1-phosphate phosphatase
MKQKTAVQIDFDGTVTVKDVSFLLLDKYVGPVWRKYLDEYSAANISVGAFNKKVFGMMKAGKKEMTEFVLSSPDVQIRPGLKELLDYCRDKGYKPVIVSNGLCFYIEALLEKQGIQGLEFHAAENVFYDGGMNVRYVGPDGKEVDAAFKEAWAAELRRQGYEIIYIGNGTSDIHPARLARQVFACEDLLMACKKENLAYYPFEDFRDVLNILKKLEAGK